MCPLGTQAKRPKDRLIKKNMATGLRPESAIINYIFCFNISRARTWVHNPYT